MSEYAGAYLIRGSERVLEALIARLTKDKVTQRGSPDLYERAYRKFGVDESQDIVERARMRPVQDAQRVFALYIPGITNEAQNALLKTIEEPAASALFFIVTPSPEMMLPTIRSRTQVLEIASEGSSDFAVDPREFLKAPAAKRLEMLKPLYEHDEDEGRDIGGVITFLQDLEREFGKLKPGKEKEEGLRALYRARGFAGDKGSLLKALLEQMALLMPTV